MKLHAGGNGDFIKALKEKYNTLREEVNKNEELTTSEKRAELKKLSELFNLEKRNAKQSLF